MGIAWFLSFIISTIFRLPKKSVLTVCLESANQNSVLSAAIIYLSLDDYKQKDIDLAIGIPIMYTIVCVVFDGIGGFIAWKLKWVSCKTPDDPEFDEGDIEDDTVTLSHFIYRYKQWRQSKKEMQLLSEQDIDYGGTASNGDIKISLEQAMDGNSVETEKSNDIDGKTPIL